MKKLMFTLAAAMAFAAIAKEDKEIVFDDEINPVPMGGIVEQKDKIPSKPIALINSQKSFAFTNLTELLQDCRLMSTLPIREGVKDAPAKIELVDCDKMGCLALFPEEFKALINMKALTADGAKPDVVCMRVKKEIVRAALFLLGSGSVNYCITRPVRSLAELDKLPYERPIVETMVHLNSAGKLGIHFIRFATYREACRQGWAPEPDTAERKAIWDEYHTKPTKPIEIKFDPKAGK